jgi:hypothetical protein
MPGPEPSDSDAMVMTTRKYHLTVPEPILVSGPVSESGETHSSSSSSSSDDISNGGKNSALTSEEDKRPVLTQSMVLNMASFMSLMRVSENDLYALLPNFIARADSRGGHPMVLSAFVDSGLDARIGAEIIGFVSHVALR